MWQPVSVLLGTSKIFTTTSQNKNILQGSQQDSRGGWGAQIPDCMHVIVLPASTTVFLKKTGQHCSSKSVLQEHLQC